ncbi:hypothetical protein, partial [Roseicella aerolata]|nr:hypothetical protein [Roseicella aerolata]
WQYTGSAAAEAVTGTGRNDHMAMGRGADTVRGGAGDDFLDGGSGNDVAAYAGSRAQYTVTMSGGLYTVRDTVPNRDGTDLLLRVEKLSFADGEVWIEQAANVSGVVHRFYNEAKGVHFFTASNEEAYDVRTKYAFFDDEGLSYRTAQPGAAGATDVFRFYNTAKEYHFYTTSAAERDFVIQTYAEYSYEGIAYQAFSSAEAGQMSLFRFYNPTTGAHFYTTSVAER